MAMVALIEEGRVVITATLPDLRTSSFQHILKSFCFMHSHPVHRQTQVYGLVPHDASSVIEAKSRPIKSEAKRSTDRALDEQMSRRSNEASLVFISTESDESNGRLQGPNP
ncbi:uncharacterized protein FFMR_14965 [Fusarium fujikuroi]|nr:uncharacterized protein FFMR_14965 [Fusarium fujikuroi]